MCLVIVSKKLIADKDIVCYKFLRSDIEDRNHFYPPYFSFCYKRNKLYKTNIITGKERFSDRTFAYNGFHSLVCKLDRYLFDSYLPDYYKLYKCIIPKGSEYYLGRDEDIVSNQIIVKRRLFFNRF